MQHHIGVDISKKDFYACFNEQDEPIKFNNDHVGIRNFIKYLNTNQYSIHDTVIGVESTGAYHLPLSLICSQNNYPIKVINPLITKKTKPNRSASSEEWQKRFQINPQSLKI